MDSHKEVRHFCGSRRDQEEGGMLDPQVIPEEIKSREIELGSKVGTSFASVVSQRRSYIVFVTLFCIAVWTAIAW